MTKNLVAISLSLFFLILNPSNGFSGDTLEELFRQKESLLNQTTRVRQEKVVLVQEIKELKERLKENELSFQKRLAFEMRPLKEKLEFTENFIIQRVNATKLPLQQKIFALEKELEITKNKSRKTSKVLSQLKSTSAGYEQELSTAKSDHKILENKYNALRKTKSRVDAKKSKKLSNGMESQIKMFELEKVIEQCNRVIRVKDRYVKSLTRRKDAVIDKLQKAEQQNDQMDQEMKSLKKKIKVLKESKKAK